MIQKSDVEHEALDVARRNFGANQVIRVMAEPAVDLDGEEAWEVTIVLEPDAAEAIDGDAVLDNLVQLRERLREKGDEGLPIVGYATEDELLESDDPES